MRMGSAPSWLGLPRGAAIALLLSLACASPVSPQSGSESESENGSESGSEADTEAEDADPLFDDIFDDEFDDRPLGYADPLERTNRGVFAFNRQVDRWVLDPLTKGYQFLVPKPGRNAIWRFFLNLSSTKVLANDLLQLQWQDAGVTSARLVVNTTVGLIGFFDVAQRWGLERHGSDFGQTLALAGTPSGAYLILPVLGPATVRDGIGTVVDGFFQPTYYVLGPANLIIGPTEILLYSGTSGLSIRERHFAELKDLEGSSIDFYAAMKSAYYQNRSGEIWGRRDQHRTSEEPGLVPVADANDEGVSTD
ncbi:MAG: VacJ family lipoprotein [Deltaproteobacteria bacterium]|nr:VacJ family lipoprotein [Deltaproteobacteria bacterium]